jgi:hypothetical protein
MQTAFWRHPVGSALGQPPATPRARAGHHARWLVLDRRLRMGEGNTVGVRIRILLAPPQG